MKRYTGIPTLGLDAIALIFIPSYFVHAGLMNAAALGAIRTAISGTNAIPLFISVLIIGSILSIDRQTLFGNLAQIVLPLVFASIAAAAIGTVIGVAVGLTWFQRTVHGGRPPSWRAASTPAYCRSLPVTVVSSDHRQAKSWHASYPPSSSASYLNDLRGGVEHLRPQVLEGRIHFVE